MVTLTLAAVETMGTMAVQTGPGVGIHGRGIEGYTSKDLWLPR